GAVNMARDLYNAIYSPLMQLAAFDVRDEQIQDAELNLPRVFEQQNNIPIDIQITDEILVKEVTIMEISNEPSHGVTDLSNTEYLNLNFTHKNGRVMESNLEQLKSVDITSSEVITEAQILPVEAQALPTNQQKSPEWLQILREYWGFLRKIPQLFGKFYHEVKRIVAGIALTIGLLFTVKLLLVLLYTINDIPFINLTFEFVGIVYVVWFVLRYLLKANSRRELATKIKQVQQEVVYGKDLEV
ncbi:CAAD domain-containing protein, partial [Anabaena sp. FACHB-83]